MIKGILFDLDNTLVDFLRMKRIASDEAARAMIGAGANFNRTVEEAGGALFEHYMAHGIESDDAFSSFLERFNENRLGYGQSVQDKVLAAGVQAYLRAKDVFLTPYPGVRRTLVELMRRQMRLGVVTDAPRLKGWQRLQSLGLAEFFEVVYTFNDTSRHKPDGLPFKMAVDALGLKPFEVLMVGDWPEKDVKGAREAGLKTAFAAYGGRKPHDVHVADRVLEKVEDLLSVLEEWRRA